MGGLAGAGFVDQKTLFYLAQYRTELVLGVLLSMPLVPWLRDRWKSLPVPSSVRIVYGYGRPVVVVALLAISIAYVVTTTFVPFVYARF